MGSGGGCCQLQQQASCWRKEEARLLHIPTQRGRKVLGYSHLPVLFMDMAASSRAPSLLLQ